MEDLFTDEMLEVGSQASQKVYWYHISFVNYLEKLGAEGSLAFSHLGTWDWEQLQYMRYDLSFILAQEGAGRSWCVRNGNGVCWGLIQRRDLF